MTLPSSTFNYDTFIFDMDGTLLDTLTDLMNSTNYALRSVGLPERSYEEIRRFVGNGIRKLMERAVEGGDTHPRFEEAFRIFKEHYLEHGEEHTRPYDGVVDLLVRLRESGKQIAVVSNKFQPAVSELSERFFPHLINVAIGEHPGVQCKPQPDMVWEAMRLLHANKESTVYVGDSDVDVQTAHNSGLPCISVLWGFRDRQTLIDCGATTFISTPEELQVD